jgi:metal-responsive CopG/Arc/MetJ family transcriptional regulator
MARVLISMTDDFLSRIDTMATDEQRTRSELVREALRTYMKRNRTVNSQKASKNAELLEDLLD